MSTGTGGGIHETNGSILDMSGQQGCPGNPAPKEYSEAQINAALAGGSPIPSDRLCWTWGLAAGNGRASQNGKYRGMATEADLIIVKAAGGAPAHDSIPAEAQFIACFDDALAWMASKIQLLGHPAVATFHFGTQYGPIDGTDGNSPVTSRGSWTPSLRARPDLKETRGNP